MEILENSSQGPAVGLQIAENLGSLVTGPDNFSRLTRDFYFVF